MCKPFADPELLRLVQLVTRCGDLDIALSSTHGSLTLTTYLSGYNLRNNYHLKDFTQVDLRRALLDIIADLLVQGTHELVEVAPDVPF